MANDENVIDLLEDEPETPTKAPTKAPAKVKKEIKLPERILVENKLEHIYGVSIPVKIAEGDVRLKNIVLFPGWNNVKSDLWVEAMRNTQVKKHLSKGNITYKDVSLDGLNVKDACEVVTQVSDPRYLKIIKGTEERAKVLDAVNDRLESILNPKYED